MDNAWEPVLDGIKVGIGYIPTAPTLKSPVCNGRGSRKVSHGVVRHCFHLCGNTSAESHAGANEEHQYQESPEHTEGRH